MGPLPRRLSFVLVAAAALGARAADLTPAELAGLDEPPAAAGPAAPASTPGFPFFAPSAPPQPLRGASPRLAVPAAAPSASVRREARAVPGTSPEPATLADQPGQAGPAEDDAGPRLAPGRQGYAFAHPRILAQQMIFGLAHGVTLLARACALLPEEGPPAQAAFAAWSERQAEPLARAEAELGRYYFGREAARVRRLDLVRALQLRTELDFPTDSPELKAACASLPAALAKPRYDLAALWLLRRDTERLRLATTLRQHVASCRAAPAALPSQEALAAALTAWEKANAPLEEVARARLLRETTADLPPVAGSDPVAEAVTRVGEWQEEIRRNVRRRFAAPGFDQSTHCSGLAGSGPEGLGASAQSLDHAFEEDALP